MNSFNILAALAEPTRLEAVRLLWDGREHCVCELMQKLDAKHVADAVRLHWEARL